MSSNTIQVVRVVDRTGRKRWALTEEGVWWCQGVDVYSEWTNRDDAYKFRWRWRAQSVAKKIRQRRLRQHWEIADE